MKTNHSQPTVLIVDDISYVRKTMKQILTSHGFRVVGEAQNGEEAVRLYEDVKPDFVTMDMVMPMMNGIEATRRILKFNPEATIIILSSMQEENLVTEAIIAGAKDYIVKPFQTDEVLRVIKSALKQKTENQQMGAVAS